MSDLQTDDSGKAQGMRRRRVLASDSAGTQTEEMVEEKCEDLKREMEEKKRRAISLVEINPTLSIAQVARHFGVSERTAAKWFDEVDFRKWYP